MAPSRSPWSAEDLARLLERCVARPGPERHLAEDIHAYLDAHGIKHTCEFTLSNGRVDLRIGDVAIELKIKGNAKKIFGQLSRYAQDPTIRAVILVSSSRRAMATMPRSLGSPTGPKPLLSVYLFRA